MGKDLAKHPRTKLYGVCHTTRREKSTTERGKCTPERKKVRLEKSTTEREKYDWRGKVRLNTFGHRVHLC